MAIIIGLSILVGIIVLTFCLVKFFAGYLAMRFVINAFDKVIFWQTGTNMLYRLDSYWSVMRYVLPISGLQKEFTRGYLAYDDDHILLLWSIFESAKRLSWKFAPWYQSLETITTIIPSSKSTREEIGKTFSASLIKTGGEEFAMDFIEFMSVVKCGYPSCYRMDGILQMIAYLCALLLLREPKTISDYYRLCDQYFPKFEEEYIVIPSLS